MKSRLRPNRDPQSGARGSRKRARTEEAHASGMDCQFVIIERGVGVRSLLDPPFTPGHE